MPECQKGGGGGGEHENVTKTDFFFSLFTPLEYENQKGGRLSSIPVYSLSLFYHMSEIETKKGEEEAEYSRVSSFNFHKVGLSHKNENETATF